MSYVYNSDKAARTTPKIPRLELSDRTPILWLSHSRTWFLYLFSSLGLNVPLGIFDYLNHRTLSGSNVNRLSLGA